VSRSESRRFLLVKAVLMPITTKAFWGGWDATAVPPPLLARSTASSISRVDTALSSDLRSSQMHPSMIHRCMSFFYVYTYVLDGTSNSCSVRLFEAGIECLLDCLVSPRHLVQEILGVVLS